MAKGDITPSEIGKHLELVRAAQKEMASADVLVCGICRHVFHLVEEFNLHKQNPCYRNATSTDSKPIIWAFMLWKQAELEKNIHRQNANSWSLYQDWVKMDENTRQTWIVAGQTLQHFSKVSQGSISEMPVKITKTVVNSRPSGDAGALRRTLMPMANANVGNRATTGAAGLRNIERNVGDENVEQSSPTSSNPLKRKATTILQQDTSKLNRYAFRTDPITKEVTEEPVEKIVAKRLNPLRVYEYLVKWEERIYDQNTWESAANLEKVPQFLLKFEKQLAAQKEAKAQQEKMNNAKKTNQLPQKLTRLDNVDANDVKKLSSGIELNTRPKTKAMNVFKQCIAGTGDGNNDLPSSSKSNSSNDVNQNETQDAERSNLNTATTIAGAVSMANDELTSTTKTEEDLEEYLIPSHTLKRMNNGNTVCVEVNSKQIKIEDEIAMEVNGETATPPLSGKILYTKADSTNRGVRKLNPDATLPIKKPRSEAQVHVLTESEMASNNVGVFKIGAHADKETQLKSLSKAQPAVGTSTAIRGAGSSVTTAVNTITIGGSKMSGVNATAAASAISNQNAVPRVTAGGAIIQRKVLPAQTNTAANSSMQNRTTAGRSIAQQNITPEQKILQLSKSGGLKVTKKVMTCDDTVPMSSSPQIAQLQMKKESQQQHDAAAAKQQQEQQEQEQLLQGLLQQQISDVDASLLFSGEQQLLATDESTPILITGEDGTVYQIAGKNAEGQTILVTQGPDGEQQFAYIASDDADVNAQMLNLDNAVAEAAQLPSDQQAAEQAALAAAVDDGQQKYLVKTTQEDGTTQVVTMTEAELAQHQVLVAQQQQQQEQLQAADGNVEPLSIQLDAAGDGQNEENIPAQIVQAGPPSPGGTRQVVLMLPDGQFVVTDMPDDQYNALNLNTN